MFFPERIKSIHPSDSVLEIGPGATPYFRSDVFLELLYDNIDERVAQSGHVGILEAEKKIVYYSGDKFPFEDNEFDYVICSHVLEHVPNVDVFLSELQRVAKKGYLEFPTVYYDYVYNFPEHISFVFEKNGIVYWMTKEESGLNKYKNIQNFFYRTCELNYHSLINDFKQFYFQGFEWFDNIESFKVNNFEKITFDIDLIDLKPQSNVISNAEDLYRLLSFKKFMKYKINQFFK